LSYFAYVLFNETANRRYIGQTDDLNRRLAEHNGASNNSRRFTRRYPGEWRLLHHETFPTRSEAVRRERWLKSGVGRAWLDAEFGRASPPQAD
jgi:putative endonuclease